MAEGTLKLHAEPLVPGKVPFGSVEQVEATAIPANVKLIEEFAPNPVPDAATRELTTPLVGVSVRAVVSGWIPDASGWATGRGGADACPGPLRAVGPTRMARSTIIEERAAILAGSGARRPRERVEDGAVLTE